MVCVCVCVYGDTEDGHCPGACHPQRFFYVPLKVGEVYRRVHHFPGHVIMRNTYTVSTEGREFGLYKLAQAGVEPWATNLEGEHCTHWAIVPLLPQPLVNYCKWWSSNGNEAGCSTFKALGGTHSNWWHLAPLADWQKSRNWVCSSVAFCNTFLLLSSSKLILALHILERVSKSSNIQLSRSNAWNWRDLEGRVWCPCTFFKIFSDECWFVIKVQCQFFKFVLITVTTACCWTLSFCISSVRISISVSGVKCPLSQLPNPDPYVSEMWEGCTPSCFRHKVGPHRTTFDLPHIVCLH